MNLTKQDLMWFHDRMKSLELSYCDIVPMEKQ